MATYLMFGSYSPRALQEMSVQRTDRVVSLIKQFSGEIEAIYATLGKFDLVLIVSLPSLEDAMKTAVALTKLTGIAFDTTPALPVEEFDKLMGAI